MLHSESSSETDTGFLDKLFQRASLPIENGGRKYYHLLDRVPMTWLEFINPSLEDTADPLRNVHDIAGWRACHTCKREWAKLSRLVRADGSSAFLSGNVDSYPKEFRSAINTFQQRVCRTPLSNQLHFNGNVGVRTAGNRADGTPYNHVYMECGLVPTELQADRLNRILHTQLPLLEQFLDAWTYDVLKVILSRYETRGEDAPGYKVNIGGLRFMTALQKELAAVRTHDRLIVMKHMMRLLAGPRPEDALGAIHIFASSSNLSACRNTLDESDFWKILQDRYNPCLYRQPTTECSVTQVAAALKLVDGDTECFEREHLSLSDDMVLKYLIWQHTPERPRDRTRINATELIALASKSKSTSKSSAKATCFDGKKPLQFCTRDMDVDQFETWLRELPVGTKVQYKVPSTVVPVEFGKPTTDRGREMVKIPVGWVLPPHGMLAESVNISPQWTNVRMVTHHPGRWRADGTLSTRKQAVVSDGLILVTDPSHTYRAGCSCLFAEFFSGDMHALGKVRQIVHNQLRIRVPDYLDDNDIYRGILLPIKYTPGRTGTSWSMPNRATFRATYHDKTMTVNVS